jgi:ATP-dependent protease ClpP protease subunit
MLIHQLSSSFWGKYEEFEDEKKNLDLMMRMIRSIYSARTSIPMRELDGLLKRDLMLDARKCLKWGLVDEIVGAEAE